MAIGNHKVEIIVGVKDFATRQLQNVARNVSTLGRNITNQGNFFNSLNRTLDSTITRLDRMANSMYRFNLYTGTLQRNLRNIGIIGAAVGGAVAYDGINNALQFDYQARKMQSRMNVSDKVREDIQDYILKDLNLKVAFSPTQIAETGVLLGQSGISSSADMKSMLKTVTFFSESVDMEVTSAAEAIVSAAKGFRIDMEKESEKIADMFTVALNESLLRAEELPHAIGQLSGRALLYGQDLPSVLVALMASRDQGLPAAQAAQNLLHGLSQGSRAGNPQVLWPKARSYFESLGIGPGIFDPDTLKIKKFPELVEDIERAIIKEGFTNNKYGIKTYEDFRAYVEEHGSVPEDIFNSMRMAPLLSRIFGRAGITPILMGMQAQYQEVDPLTGEKVGQVYFGSDALKKMYDKIVNSDGQTERTHKIIEESGLFQLQVLKGAWQAVQVDMLDNMVPVIKAGAEQLTNVFAGRGVDSPQDDYYRYVMGGPEAPSRLDVFEQAFKDAAENYRKDGNTLGAEIVEGIGKGIINSIKIGGTMPAMFRQIGGAFTENILKGDWGSSLIEFPVKLVKNGVKFINDLIAANDEFKALVEKLPEDLQDPAKLIEQLTKGGIILLVTGAIIKVIELGVRAVATSAKLAKLGMDLGKYILDGLFGEKNGKSKNPLNTVTNINANVVNVYGKAINEKDGKNPPGTTVVDAKSNKGGKGTGTGTSVGKWGKMKDVLTKGGRIIGGALPVIIATDIISGAMGGGSYTKDFLESDYNPLKLQKDKNIEELREMVEIINDPSLYTGPKFTELVPTNKTSYIKDRDPSQMIDKTYFEAFKNSITNSIAPIIQKDLHKPQIIAGETLREVLPMMEKANLLNLNQVETSIINGFNEANNKLDNIKLDNNININVTPNITITGNIPANALNVKTSNTTYSSSVARTDQDLENILLQRRLGWK